MQIVIDIAQNEYDALEKLDASYLLHIIKDGKPLPQCKDCKHFETDVVATCDGIPLIVGHECCTKWGDGCKTKEDGYCFMFEADKEVDDGSD